MQYAHLELQDSRVIIDAWELSVLSNLKGNSIKEYEPTEDELIPKVVYGAVLPQYNYTETQIMNWIDKSIGKALAYINDDGVCVLLELLDIELSEEITNSKIPFSALIRSNIKMDNKNHQSFTTFLRLSNLSPEDNILNRYGVLAIKSVEQRKRDVPTKDNWKNFIDKKRMQTTALKIL
jgi:hypothetical protein